MNLIQRLFQTDLITATWISFIIEAIIILLLSIPVINWHLTKNDEKVKYLYDSKSKKAEKRLSRFLHRNLY